MKHKHLSKMDQLSEDYCVPCKQPRKGDMIPCQTCPIYYEIGEHSMKIGYRDSLGRSKYGVTKEDVHRIAWTKEDEDLLEREYGSMPTRELANKLNRSVASLQSKYKRMKGEEV